MTLHCIPGQSAGALLWKGSSASHSSFHENWLRAFDEASKVCITCSFPSFLFFFLFLNFFFFLPAEHATAQSLPSLPEEIILPCFLPPFHFWLHMFLHNHLIYLPDWLFCVKEQQIKTEKPFETQWSILKACPSYEDHACHMWHWSGAWHKAQQFSSWEPVSSLV